MQNIINYEKTNNKKYHLNYNDLDKDDDIIGPCVIWGAPTGTIFVSHDDNVVLLTLTEKLMLRIGVLTIEALNKKYNKEPQRGW